MRRREFTRPHEELVPIAIDRAAETLRSIFAVLEKSGHAPYVSLDGTAGAAGLLAVAHASFKEALIEVEHEHEQFDAAELMPLTPYAPDPEALARAHVRLTRLHSVPQSSMVSGVAGWPASLDFDEQVTGGTSVGGRRHEDGTPCTCPPECNCHPSTRNEDPIVTGERGSWHLDTCPASPKNHCKGDDA